MSEVRLVSHLVCKNDAEAALYVEMLSRRHLEVTYESASVARFDHLGTSVAGMSLSGGTSVNTRLATVQGDFRRRQTRLLMMFVTLESVAMLALFLAIFAFEVIDFEIGVWILLGIVAIGGFVMSIMLVSLAKARALAVNEAQGITPLP